MMCFYEAKDLFSDCQVFVKAYNIEMMNTNNSLIKQSFDSEFKILKNYKLPHSIKLLKVFKSQNTIYMVYEKPESSLKEYICVHGFPKK